MSSIAIDSDKSSWAGEQSAVDKWRAEWDERARNHPRAARQGFVFTRGQCSLSTAEIRSRVQRKIWWVPRWGVLSVIHPGTDPQVAAALAATAAALTRQDAVVSHASAAILDGLPVLITPRAPIVTATARSGHRQGLDLHLTAIEAAERSEWYGAALTSGPRTIVDIARSAGPASGLITAEAALREGLLSLAELAESVTAAAGRPGNRAARWVAEHADAGSESPLESLIRARILLADLPCPRLQVWIGEANARVDMLYERERLIIEADGMLKYMTPADLRDEKRRQERLERAGYRVLRVMWDDVFGDPTEFLIRLNRALRR